MTNYTGKKGTAVNSPKSANIISMLQPPVNELFGQIKSQLDQERGKMKAALLDINKTLQQMNASLNKSMDLITGTDSRMTQAEKQIKQHEDELIKREMELAAYIIRIQNVKYDKGENLYDKAANILVSLNDLAREDLIRDLDSARRSHTAYTRSHNQPLELIIKLVRKAMCDIIFKTSKINNCEFEGNKLVFLKEVPWHLRQKRKNFKNLTSWLHKQGIFYRWMIPEGVQFIWKSKTVKLETVSKAQNFLEKHEQMRDSISEDSDKEDEQGGGGRRGRGEYLQGNKQRKRKKN